VVRLTNLEHSADNERYEIRFVSESIITDKVLSDCLDTTAKGLDWLVSKGWIANGVPDAKGASRGISSTST
jgi:hypothetical protein